MQIRPSLLLLFRFFYYLNLFVFSIPLYAETSVRGIISSDTRWTAEAGPYIITDDLVVNRGASLSIGPGTRIIVNSKGTLRGGIPQLDYTDSLTVSIKIYGSLSCIGGPDRRIVFSSAKDSSWQCVWYGIVIDRASSEYTEIAFSDIVGACNGVIIRECKPLIRNCIFEFNNIAINCLEGGSASCYNNVVTRNFVAGVKIYKANPVFYNNIIAFNKNFGVWCDEESKITFRYNCVFGNDDGDFSSCDPELGIVKTQIKSNRKVDYADNILMDPVFAGSQSDSIAVETDIFLPTEKSKILDTNVAKILYDTLSDSLAVKKRQSRYPRYALSKYSPCIDAGNPAKEFKDSDGSRNDIGIGGGPNYFSKSK